MLIQIDTHKPYHHLTHCGKALCGADVDIALPISAPSVKTDLCVECLSIVQDMVRIVKDDGHIIIGCLLQEAANLEGFSGREKGERLLRLLRRVSVLRELAAKLDGFQEEIWT